MEFQELFRLGMKRLVPNLLAFPGRAINVGSSKGDRWPNFEAEPLGRPDWVFPIDNLPYDDHSIATIHCYHFLEHLTGDDAIRFLREAERVMIPNGSVLNFCMPYYSSNLQAECLDHRSSWNENSFRNLFNNSGYDLAGKWDLRCHFIMIAGLVERNLCVIGQLAR
jgi:hypothetical protein